MLLLGLGVALLFTGGMTVYFGEGKTRIAGIVQLVIAIVALVVMFAAYVLPYKAEFVQSFIAVLGGVVGALIGAGVFLVTIIKA